MKTKLTLSISKAHVRRVKAYSLRHRRSVSQLFEELIDALDVEITTKERKNYAVDKLDGLLTGKFSPEDLAQDTRLSRIMGK
jgi:hypothetical protein